MSVGDFPRSGLLRLPGAIAREHADAMVARVREHLERTYGADTPAGPVTGLRSVTAAPEFEALGSPAIVATLDDLLGPGHWQPPRRWGRLLVTYPSGQPEWTLPTGSAWHNDFIPLHPSTIDRAVQLFMILQDLPAGGGGTLVLTGSHRLVARYITESGNPPHPRHLRSALPPLTHLSTDYMRDGVRVDDVDLRIVELTGQAGDAFVMHCDTFHAAAPNCGREPRIMATSIVLRDL
jgi:hypothetical protein